MTGNRQRVRHTKRDALALVWAGINDQAAAIAAVRADGQNIDENNEDAIAELIAARRSTFIHQLSEGAHWCPNGKTHRMISSLEHAHPAVDLIHEVDRIANDVTTQTLRAAHAALEEDARALQDAAERAAHEAEQTDEQAQLIRDFRAANQEAIRAAIIARFNVADEVAAERLMTEDQVNQRVDIAALEYFEYLNFD